jgi:hypothetical protein
MSRLPAAGLLLAATLGLAGSTSAPGPQSQGLPADTRPAHVVLVELFTSQGCSSCPPADRLLATLGEDDAGRIVPLSFHVDFWNSGGWTDPFSTKEWTQRQVAYARALGLSQVYTPQAVVDGGTEMVGSDADRLRAAIAAAAARPAGEVALHLDPSASRVKVGVDVSLPEALRGQNLDLVAVVFERGLVTPVGRGENGGKTLRNDYVVRTLERVDRLAAKGPPLTHHTASLRLSKDWEPTRLGVAAFLQDPKSLEIRGAAAEAIAIRAGN